MNKFPYNEGCKNKGSMKSLINSILKFLLINIYILEVLNRFPSNTGCKIVGFIRNPYKIKKKKNSIQLKNIFRKLLKIVDF